MIKTLALTFSAIALSACASSGEIGLNDDFDTNATFGQSVRQNIAAQIVNPTPSTEPVQASGARVAKAVDAYEKDKVEKPRPPGTLSIQSSGQSGGN
jgi:type IV pilus biogenesis protein CpaD/CtpE